MSWAAGAADAAVTGADSGAVAAAPATFGGVAALGAACGTALVGAAVLVGNVLRNSVLVALQASGHGALPGVHEGVGLAALAAVCGVIAMGMAARRAPADQRY